MQARVRPKRSLAECEAQVTYPEQTTLKAISDAYYERADNSSKHRGELGNFVTLRLAKLEFSKISRQIFSNFQIGNDSGDACKEFGSNIGHDPISHPFSCGVVGCHLRRKVFEFAVSHDTDKPKVGDPSTATEASGVKRLRATAKRAASRRGCYRTATSTLLDRGM